MASRDAQTTREASHLEANPPVRRTVLGADAALSLLDYGRPDPETIRGCPQIAAQIAAQIADAEIGDTVAEVGCPMNADSPASMGMILLHGIRDHAAALDEVAYGFRRRFHVVSLDLRGHGHSEHPGAYSFALMVADLLSVVRQMAFERFVVVAHSLGAQIASHYAALFPQGLEALVVAEGMGAPRRRNAATADERARHDRARIDGLLETTGTRRRLPSLEDAERRLVRNHPRLTGARLRRIAEAAVEPLADGGYRWRWDPRVQGVWSTNTWELTAQRWANVGCPTLVMSAELANEHWFRGRTGHSGRPSEADRLAIERNVSLFADARHRELDGVGHMIHYDAPERMIALVDAFFREIGLAD